MLSPLEEEKSKVKKKNLKSIDHEKEAEQTGGKPEKIKGKKKSEKQRDEPMQEDYNTPWPSTNSQNGEDITSGHNNTTSTTPSDDFKAIIGSHVEEMRNLRQTVHHDIRDLQNAVSQQKVDITQMKQSVKDAKQEIKKLLIEKIDNNAQNIQSIMDEYRSWRPCIGKGSHK